MNCVARVFDKKPRKLILKKQNKLENRFHLLELSTAREFCIGFYRGPSETENTKEVLTKANQILEGIPYKNVGLGWYDYNNAIKMGILQDLESTFGLLLYKTNECYRYLDGKETEECRKAIEDFPAFIKRVKDGEEKCEHHETPTPGRNGCRCGGPDCGHIPTDQQVLKTKLAKNKIK